jgi:predicted ATP-grasp superfamily ATP-dependent carboligase
MSRGGSANVYVGFYGFYVSSASYYYSPVTTSEETVVYMQTNIYETSKGTLIWSVKSQSFEPQNTGDVIKTVSYNVVNELALQGYFK